MSTSCYNISVVTKLLSLIRAIRIERLVASSEASVLPRSVSSNATMSESQQIGKYFEIAKKLVINAGEVFNRGILEEKTVETKSSDCDFVTEHDRRIEEILISGLSAEFPDHKFVAEESCSESTSLPELTDSPTWFIDPIDGTTNFIHGFSQCCISIGLTVRKRIELGIIYNPTSNEMYTAIRGRGAFLNEKSIKTSEVSQLKKSLIGVELAVFRAPSNYRDIVIGRLEAMANASEGLRGIGSAALALAYVARGTLDAFQLDILKPWDVAAGIIIVEEAGGVVIDTKGGSIDLMKPRTLAAANDALALEISKLVVDTDLQTQRKRLKRVPSSSKLV